MNCTPKKEVSQRRTSPANRGVIFLTLLLMQTGRMLSNDSLLKLLWDESDIKEDRERSLRNMGYSVKKNLTQIFPDKPFLDIQKNCFSISRRYSITTDLDYFTYRVRDIEGIKDPEEQLEKYLAVLEDFSGMVLPDQDHSVIGNIVEMYENRRNSVQDTCLELMYDLQKYNKMREFIVSISSARGWIIC